VVNFAGDANNNPISDFTSSTEQVIITEVTPTLTTSATPSTASVGDTVTLSDTATLTGQVAGDAGTVTFTLTAPDGSTVYTSAALPETGNFSQPSSTPPLTLSQVGTYTWHASYNDEGNITADTGVNETVTVGLASPQLSTQASAGGLEGIAAVSDTATFSGGFNETGLITFQLEDANNTIVFEDTKLANGTSAVTSDSYTPAEDGTYHWVVSFAGDSNNNPISDFTSAQEQVVITEVTPTLTTLATPSTATVGQTVTLGDTAILTGQGPGDEGTVIFTLTAPDGSIVYTSAPLPLAVNANESTSTALTLSQVGTYTWHAVYDDEGNLTNDTGVNETVTVVMASPQLSTTPNPTTANLGVKLQDVANLAGGFNPTGSITFKLYAPNVDPTVGPAAYTETVTGVNGDGSYHTSTGFATNVTGVWHWVATYNGDSNNNSASSGPLDEAVTIPPAADLGLTKTVDNATPNVGDTVTFTITLTNHGPDTATNVIVSELLPPGLKLLSSHPSQGTYVGGVWNVGTVTTSVAPTLTITAKVVSPKAETNAATITHSDQHDPNTGNNTSSVTVTPPMVNLVLSKTVNQSQVKFGSNVTFTFVISNLGPDTAHDVVLSDPFPRGLAFVSSAVPSQGTYSPVRGVWTVGTLAAGASATLRVTFRVLTMRPVVNTARVSELEFDPDQANNVASARVNPATISKRMFFGSNF
jgi:uncharacterized repeat protein (TIGR01451 family)